MKGYTLIELIIVLSLFIIILLGGTALFTQNLRSDGFTEIDLKMNSSLRSTLDQLEKTLRFSKVVMVESSDRDLCLTSGSSGVSGTSLIAEDSNGLRTMYSLVDSKVASTSTQNNEQVFLSPADISINSLTVEWFCQSGISDKINLQLNASSFPLGLGVTITKSVEREVILLNSSY